MSQHPRQQPHNPSGSEELDSRGQCLREDGFTMVEVMVVLAIIMLLAVLSIPRFTRSLARAEEAAAEATLYGIRGSQEAHRTLHGIYASSFRVLNSGGGPLVPADGETGGGGSGEDVWVHNGYIFRLYRPTPLDYSVTAEPIRDRISMTYFTMDPYGNIQPGDRPRGAPGGGGTPPGEEESPPGETPPT